MFELLVLEVKTGKLVKKSNPFDWNGENATKTYKGVRVIYLSPDGARIAVGNGGSWDPEAASVILFDAATLARAARLGALTRGSGSTGSGSSTTRNCSLGEITIPFRYGT